MFESRGWIGPMSLLERLNPLRKWKSRKSIASDGDLYEIFRCKYESFKELLDSNAELSKILTDIEEKLQGHEIFGMSYIRSQSTRAVFHTLRMVKSLDVISRRKHPALFNVLDEINEKIKNELGVRKEAPIAKPVLNYSEINREMVDWVGGKSANLGEVLNRVGLPVPEGFAITTYAYELFLAHNELIDEINKRTMEIDPNAPDTINSASEEIQRLIISGQVPAEVEEAILSAYQELTQRLRERGPAPDELQPRVSMRSSAIGEDSELSYAGQYLSLLNVLPDRLIQSYKFIIASLYTPRAISYRLSKGIRDEDISMSVACLEMVESCASGVMYTRHPFNMLDDNIIINAVWGLGPYAVDGHITPDAYTVSKGDKPAIIDVKTALKPVQLISDPHGGLKEIDVPADKREQACLSPEQIVTLAGYGAKLERHYHYPQDVEWAIDREGRLLILQTRPLRESASGRSESSALAPVLSQYPLLIEGCAVAHPGVGSGPVFQVNSEDDLFNFPDGAVLVARHSSPKFVIVMRKAEAIIADSGSVTGHMASLAREFGIPTVLDAKVATSIPAGAEVTVDAYSGRIYKGKVSELLALKKTRESHMEDAPVYRTLKSVADLIVPLHLVDPKSPDFNPGSCRSLHDIMRLVHEFSYAEMFQISDLFSGKSGWAVKLEAPIPFDLYIIDLGGGLIEKTAKKGRVSVDEVVSAPFSALLSGMLHEDLRTHGPRPIELRGFFSVMSEQMFTNTYGAERFGDRSYAIISDKYVNFSSRVGYHYSVLDAYCGRTINKNYITFSFKGGAADDVRRGRRIRAIAAILRELDFSVEAVGDRVDARFQKYECSVIREKLDAIGKLLIFTRQMDMLMHSEASVTTVAESFLAGNYHLDASHPNGKTNSELQG
jgi:pyruvate,water dikinase